MPSESENEKIYKVGEVVFKENDRSTEMYIIKKGKVKITKRIGSQESDLAVMGPGEFFGEMSLLDNMPRSATVTAIQETTLMIVTRNMFDDQLKKIPDWFTKIIEVIISRLRQADRRLEALLMREDTAKVCTMLSILFDTDAVITDLGKNIAYSYALSRCASALGMNQLTVKRVFNQLRKLEIILVVDGQDDSKILLPKEASLEQFTVFLQVKNRMLEEPETKLSKFLDSHNALESLRRLSWLTKTYSRKLDEGVALDYNLVKARMTGGKAGDLNMVRDWTNAELIETVQCKGTQGITLLVNVPLLEQSLTYLEVRRELEVKQRQRLDGVILDE